MTEEINENGNPPTLSPIKANLEPSGGMQEPVVDTAPEPLDPAPQPITDTHTDTPSSCAKYFGALLDKDCDECYPSIAMDGNEVIIGVDNYLQQKSIIFMQYINGNFQEVTTFDVDHDIADVAISSGRAAVGSPSERNSTGGAHIYEHGIDGGWAEATHIAPDLLPNSKFGTDLDIDGDLMVVVPSGKVSNDAVESPVYIYRRIENTWVEEKQINRRGSSISIKGNSFALGYHSPMESAVFIYTYAQSAESNEWTLIDELSNGDCDAGFGISVAFEPGRLLAGCDAENLNTGAIYYFESSVSNQYSVVQKIISSDGRSRDNLGGSDQIATVTTASGSFMAAGTYRNKNGGVYIFKLDEQNNLWKEISKLDPVASSKQFGDRVVMSGDKLIVSSACNVYAYTLEDCFE